MNNRILIGIIIVLVVIVTVLLLQQPSTQTGSLCGNGVCDTREDKTCPQDCIGKSPKNGTKGKPPAINPTKPPIINQTKPPFINDDIPPQSSMLSAYVEGNPTTISSDGDLWLNTWADDGNIYSGWGDGKGFGDTWTDFGVARLTGDMPNLLGENIFADPFPCDDVSGTKEELNRRCNDKVSSLLFLDGVLYAQLHSPLGDPYVGYLAYSEDYGRTWIRLREESPWTADKVSSSDRALTGSNFRCMFFINMGKDYELNTDGFVYAFGIGREWGWGRGVYLARVQKEKIMDYGSYEYFAGLSGNGTSVWSAIETDAVPVQGLIAPAQFSSIFHPGAQSYIIMTEENVYDAPNPWGPWHLTAQWVNEGWAGYQPGIISKDTGQDYFWFTIAGQPQIGNDIQYQLNLGKMILANLVPSALSCGDGICDGAAGEKQTCPQDCLK